MVRVGDTAFTVAVGTAGDSTVAGDEQAVSNNIKNMDGLHADNSFRYLLGCSIRIFSLLEWEGSLVK
jgi:hypothetical protein